MNDWTAFGRVDADGTVYVKTAEGDRVVGSWQAGTPEEGLAHFARRFADLVTEVELVEARLKSGAADAAHSLSSVKRLRALFDRGVQMLSKPFSIGLRLEQLQSVIDRAQYGNAAGIWMNGSNLKSLRPASSTSTLTDGSALSRLASADPADPPPTMTMS